MGLLYWSSSMTAETQSLQPMLETFKVVNLLKNFSKPSVSIWWKGDLHSEFRIFFFIEFFIEKGLFSYFF